MNPASGLADCGSSIPDYSLGTLSSFGLIFLPLSFVLHIHYKLFVHLTYAFDFWDKTEQAHYRQQAGKINALVW
jgi:hypothetical protein